MPLPTFTPLLKEFCSTGDKLAVPNNSTPTQANMVDGFPVSEQTPLSEGGQRVQRPELNGVFNLLSKFANFSSLGGKPIYDVAVANAGGYSKNAILQYIDPVNPKNSYEAISLIDNNTVNLSTNGADGVNWAKIAELNGDIVGFDTTNRPNIKPYRTFKRNDYNVKTADDAVNLITMGGNYQTTLPGSAATGFNVPLPAPFVKGSIYFALFSGYAYYAPPGSNNILGNIAFNPYSPGDPTGAGTLRFNIIWPNSNIPASDTVFVYGTYLALGT